MKQVSFVLFLSLGVLSLAVANEARNKCAGAFAKSPLARININVPFEPGLILITSKDRFQATVFLRRMHSIAFNQFHTNGRRVLDIGPFVPSQQELWRALRDEDRLELTTNISAYWPKNLFGQSAVDMSKHDDRVSKLFEQNDLEYQTFFVENITENAFITIDLPQGYYQKHKKNILDFLLKAERHLAEKGVFIVLAISWEDYERLVESSTIPFESIEIEVSPVGNWDFRKGS